MKKEVAIHLKDKSEWDQLMSIFDACNLRWRSDRKAKEIDLFGRFKEYTCVWVTDIYRIASDSVLYVKAYTDKKIVSLQQFMDGEF